MYHSCYTKHYPQYHRPNVNTGPMRPSSTFGLAMGMRITKTTAAYGGHGPAMPGRLMPPPGAAALIPPPPAASRYRPPPVRPTRPPGPPSLAAPRGRIAVPGHSNCCGTASRHHCRNAMMKTDARVAASVGEPTVLLSRSVARPHELTSP